MWLSAGYRVKLCMELSAGYRGLSAGYRLELGTWLFARHSL